MDKPLEISDLSALAGHWAYDPSVWTIPERATHVDSGLLFLRDDNFAVARASLTRAFRAAFGVTFPLRDGAKAQYMSCSPILSEQFAALVFRTLPTVYGVISFRSADSRPPALFTFSLGFYDGLSAFALTLYASPYHTYPNAAHIAVDTIFASLADDRRWSWDARIEAPVRRSPHLSWLQPNRYDRTLLLTEELDTAMLELVVPHEAARDEEEAVATRLHPLVVGRIPVLNIRAAEGEHPHTYRLRLARGWFRPLSPVDSPDFAYSFLADAPASDLRSAVIDLRTAVGDAPAFSFPIGFHARAGFDIMAAAIANRAPVAPADDNPEIAQLRREIDLARAQADQLQRELLDARAARDRFRDLVGELRSARTEAVASIDAAASHATPAPVAVACDLAPLAAPPTLPADWRDADALLAWLHKHYGPRIIFHPRARSGLVDAPNTLDERALADILDILGRDYLPMMDGDAAARARYLRRSKRYKAGKGIGASSAGVVRGYEFLFEGERIDPAAIRKLRERGRSMAGRAACVYFLPLRDGRLLIVSLPRHLATVDS